MNIVDIYTLYGGSKAGSKQIFQLLVSEVVDSQQWRISPSNGRLDFTRCRRFNFKVTYYCSNHLKLHMSIYKSLYYENLLSIFIKFLLFSHGYTPHYLEVSDFLLVYSLTGCHKIKVFSHLYMSKSLETYSVYRGNIPLRNNIGNYC